MISFALTEEQQLVKETAHKFAAEVIRPNLRAWERAGAVPEEARRAFRDLGLTSLELDPESANGQGLTTAVLVHEELSWGDPGAALALWTTHTLGPALRELADAEQAQRLLAPFLAHTAHTFALAYSEEWKTVPTGFATQAVPDKGGYLLSGIKSFVWNAEQADLSMVFAQLNPDAGWDGIAAFAVPRRPRAAEGGLRAGDRHDLLGLRTAWAGELHMEDHFVPEEDRLRGGGDLRAAAQRLFARAGLCTAARQVGLGRAAYEYALAYTQDRKAFGKPVAHFQANAFTLSDMLMDVDSARLLCWRAAAAADKGRLDVGLCAQALAHANEAAFRVADQAVQLLGGAGFMQDFPVEKWLRDTEALALSCGTSEQAREIAAAEELGQAARVLPGSAIQPIFT